MSILPIISESLLLDLLVEDLHGVVVILEYRIMVLPLYLMLLAVMNQALQCFSDLLAINHTCCINYGIAQPSVPIHLADGNLLAVLGTDFKTHKPQLL